MRLILFVSLLLINAMVDAQALVNCETPCCQEYQSMIEACNVDERAMDHATSCLKFTHIYEDCKKEHPEMYGPGFE